jgi:hypothetical protein
MKICSNSSVQFENEYKICGLIDSSITFTLTELGRGELMDVQVEC